MEGSSEAGQPAGCSLQGKRAATEGFAPCCLRRAASHPVWHSLPLHPPPPHPHLDSFLVYEARSTDGLQARLHLPGTSRSTSSPNTQLPPWTGNPGWNSKSLRWSGICSSWGTGQELPSAFKDQRWDRRVTENILSKVRYFLGRCTPTYVSCSTNSLGSVEDNMTRVFLACWKH